MRQTSKSESAISSWPLMGKKLNLMLQPAVWHSYSGQALTTQQCMATVSVGPRQGDLIKNVLSHNVQHSVVLA